MVLLHFETLRLFGQGPNKWLGCGVWGDVSPPPPGSRNGVKTTKKRVFWPKIGYSGPKIGYSDPKSSKKTGFSDPNRVKTGFSDPEMAGKTVVSDPEMAGKTVVF